MRSGGELSRLHRTIDHSGAILGHNFANCVALAKRSMNSQDSCASFQLRDTSSRYPPSSSSLKRCDRSQDGDLRLFPSVVSLLTPLDWDISSSHGEDNREYSCDGEDGRDADNSGVGDDADMRGTDMVMMVGG